MKPVKCKCSRASALPLQCGICSINFYRASQPPSINLSITFQSNLSEFPTTCFECKSYNTNRMQGNDGP